MSKKKKKKKENPKKKKHVSGVEERIKSIQSIQLPDENPFKKDNENTVDRFFRFHKKVKPKLPKKIAIRKKH